MRFRGRHSQYKQIVTAGQATHNGEWLTITWHVTENVNFEDRFAF